MKDGQIYHIWVLKVDVAFGGLVGTFLEAQTHRGLEIQVECGKPW